MKIQLPNTLICGVRRHEWTKDGKTNVMHFLDWYCDEAHSSIVEEKEAEEYGKLKGQYATAAIEIREYQGKVNYNVLAVRPQNAKG